MDSTVYGMRISADGKGEIGDFDQSFFLGDYRLIGLTDGTGHVSSYR